MNKDINKLCEQDYTMFEVDTNAKIIALKQYTKAIHWKRRNN